MPPANLLIIGLPASVAFLLILLHCWKVRGAKTTLAFFPIALAFGFLRGNLVNIITSGRVPYRFSMPPMLKIGHTGIVEAIGWVLAAYLAWCLAERVLTGRNEKGINVFALVAVACLVLALFAFMMEAAAGRMGWWKWKPPKGLTESPAFRDVERGLPAWFSVGFDFLLAWLLFFKARLKRLWYAVPALFIFPFHFGMHKIRHFHLGEHLIKMNHLAHHVMYFSVLLLPLVFFVETRDVPDFKRQGPGWARRLDLAALFIVIWTVILGLAFYAHKSELCIFAIPLTAMGLYGWWWSEFKTDIKKEPVQ